VDGDTGNTEIYYSPNSPNGETQTATFDCKGATLTYTVSLQD
jgi:hypothetical protein